MKTRKNSQFKLALISIALLVFVAIFSATLTFAYFTDKKEVTSGNVTFGKIVINNNACTSLKKTCSHDLAPGCTIAINKSSVKLMEGSTLSSFVRISVEITGGSGAAELIVDNGSGLWCTTTGKFVAGTPIYYKGKATATSDLDLSKFKIKIPLSYTNQNGSVTVKLKIEAIQADHAGVDGAEINLSGTPQEIATNISKSPAWGALK